MDKILAALRKGLGLAETATEEDIQKCLTTLNAKIADFETKIVALSAQKGSAVSDQKANIVSNQNDRQTAQ